MHFFSALDMSLEQAINDSQLAIQYFFNNQFVNARNLLEPWFVFMIFTGTFIIWNFYLIEMKIFLILIFN